MNNHEWKYFQPVLYTCVMHTSNKNARNVKECSNCIVDSQLTMCIERLDWLCGVRCILRDDAYFRQKNIFTINALISGEFMQTFYMCCVQYKLMRVYSVCSSVAYLYASCMCAFLLCAVQWMLYLFLFCPSVVVVNSCCSNTGSFHRIFWLLLPYQFIFFPCGSCNLENFIKVLFDFFPSFHSKMQ